MGKAKVDINNKKFIITEYCDKKIAHLTIDYDEFVNLYEAKNYKQINFEDNIIQKYYLIYYINKLNDISYSKLAIDFFNLTKIKFNISNSQFYRIKNNTIDNYKGLSLIELINKIKIEIPDLYININDVKYNINIKNKNIERQQTIIFFGIKKNFDLLDTKITKEIFLDITFKIIPRNFYPYKLLVIAGITQKEKKPKILTFILTKYLDHISYNRIWNYLYENHNFQPNIIHSDFEQAIAKSLNNNKNINNNLIHIRCFFHYSKMIRTKL